LHQGDSLSPLLFPVVDDVFQSHDQQECVVEPGEGSKDGVEDGMVISGRHYLFLGG
jgi:hypothetical protein